TRSALSAPAAVARVDLSSCLRGNQPRLKGGENREGERTPHKYYPSASDTVQDCFLRTGGAIITGPMEKPDLLARILERPFIERVVPRLQPEVLHKVIERCGLEDCVELVALISPEQLVRVFDLDLWRAARSGLDDQLDPARFGVWIEVLME